MKDRSITFFISNSKNVLKYVEWYKTDLIINYALNRDSILYAFYCK